MPHPNALVKTPVVRFCGPPAIREITARYEAGSGAPGGAADRPLGLVVSHAARPRTTYTCLGKLL